MAEGDKLRRVVADVIDDALHDAAEELLRRARTEIPPTDPADDPDPAVTLSELGYIRPDQGGRSVVAGFEGPYAAKQELAQQFDHPRGGKAGYLEDALKSLIPDLPEIVASKIKARLEGRATRKRGYE
jgi:hypothetical protein